MLTAEMVKKRAAELGADLCGIGDISCFAGQPAQRDPLYILPHARCVIGFAFRIPVGLYEVLGRGLQHYNFASLAVKYNDEERADMFLQRMASLIENEGYDACLQRSVPNLKIKGDKTQNFEVSDTYELIYAEAVAPDKPVPEVMLDTAVAAVACGLGSKSRMGNVLTPQFGPFQRLFFIITDAPLECDKPFEGSLCDNCGECAKACPGHAIGEEEKDTWQCSVYYRGAHRSNPLLPEHFLEGDPEREAILNGDKRFDAESARAIYPKLDFLPFRRTGYVAPLCGRPCEIACWKHLKSHNG